jgi:LuxR family maltose regulon positive regulatory protein
VLVSTPAGYGKTTLLSSWYAAHQEQPPSERGPVLAWLSLEPADNDPARFWLYTLRALQNAHKKTPDHPVMELDISPLAPTETFLTALLNAFSAPGWKMTSSMPGETVLILDEYHVITSEEIQAAIAFLLEHLPASLHVLIASRTYPALPLTQLRAGGYLAELRAEDMNFSAEETAQFLQSALPLTFTTDEVARLQERTGGWIMPLYLAALAWRSHQDTATFIASLRGDHHAVVEYLMAEVFSQQSVDIQRFLLATSLLAECTGPLCDAVVQQTGSQDLLEQLEREHLFLFPVEQTHRWYRYQAVFLDFLQDRVRRMYPEEMAVWHSRAADWYLQQEAAEGDTISRALPHLLAIQAWERAARLLEAVAQRMVWQTGEVMTLLRWLLELPTEIIDAHPRLGLASAWTMTLSGQFDAAQTALQSVDRFLCAGDSQITAADKTLLDRQISGEALAIRARIASFHEIERASALSRQSLAHLPEHNDVLRADLLLNLGYAYLRRHDYVAAGRVFKDARRIGIRSGNARAVMLSSRYLAGSYVERGSLNDAAMVYRQALRLATSMHSTPPLAAGTIYVANAMLLYERNDPQAALEQVQQGLALGLRSGEMKTLFPGYLALAQIHQGMGDTIRAWQALQEAERLADFHLFTWTEQEVAVAQARLHLAQGTVDSAVRALSKEEWHRATRQALPFGVCPPAIQLAWARVLLAQHRPDDAAALLQRVRDGYRREQPHTGTLPVVALHALALAAGGAVEHAVSLLADVLPTAIRQGYIRTFVDEGPAMGALLRHVLVSGDVPEVEALLAAFPASRLQTLRTPVASLTSESLLSVREVEVMQLLAAGMSNQQIADELVVALSTVRTHNKHIYRKLGVQGRVRAVARATALHLL